MINSNKSEVIVDINLGMTLSKCLLSGKSGYVSEKYNDKEINEIKEVASNIDEVLKNFKFLDPDSRYNFSDISHNEKLKNALKKINDRDKISVVVRVIDGVFESLNHFVNCNKIDGLKDRMEELKEKVDNVEKRYNKPTVDIETTPPTINKLKSIELDVNYAMHGIFLYLASSEEYNMPEKDIDEIRKVVYSFDRIINDASLFYPDNHTDNLDLYQIKKLKEAKEKEHDPDQMSSLARTVAGVFEALNYLANVKGQSWVSDDIDKLKDKVNAIEKKYNISGYESQKITNSVFKNIEYDVDVAMLYTPISSTLMSDFISTKDSEKIIEIWHKIGKTVRNFNLFDSPVKLDNIDISKNKKLKNAINNKNTSNHFKFASDVITGLFESVEYITSLQKNEQSRNECKKELNALKKSFNDILNDNSKSL